MHSTVSVARVTTCTYIDPYVIYLLFLVVCVPSNKSIFIVAIIYILTKHLIIKLDESKTVDIILQIKFEQTTVAFRVFCI